jgi:hypothetical protein
VDALHYRFAITLSEDTPFIEAEAAVTLRLLDPSLREVALDLIEAAGGTGMTVTSVFAGTRPVAFRHEAGRLHLAVPDDHPRGGQVTFTITYGGIPGEGLRAHTTIHGARGIFSENWPDRARHWLPMIDHPYDKATGEFLVTAPAVYQVVSNGRLGTARVQGPEAGTSPRLSARIRSPTRPGRPHRTDRRWSRGRVPRHRRPHAPPGPRVDGRPGAPPRRPARRVGEEAEDRLARRADGQRPIQAMRMRRVHRRAFRWGPRDTARGPRRVCSSSASSLRRQSRSRHIRSSAAPSGPSARRFAR